MKSVLVDADILIEVARGRNADIVARWMDLSNSGDAVLYSPVSVAELWAGARPKEHEALGNLFLALTCAPIDEEACRRAGFYLHPYRRSGAEMWTRNRKHYPMKDIVFFDSGMRLQDLSACNETRLTSTMVSGRAGSSGRT